VAATLLYNRNNLSQLPFGTAAMDPQVLQKEMDDAFQADPALGWCLNRGTAPNVKHVRQCRSWDCGLACIQMVARLRNDALTFKEISKLCGNITSIWTVHLSSVLLQRNIAHAIVTTCAGVNQDLESLSFYQDHIEQEKNDVLRLFNTSINNGIRIIESGYSGVNFKHLLLTRRVVLIVLVDNRGLRCTDCGCMKRNWFSCGFTGHYVLVQGYDEEREAFVYHDPADRVQKCWMTLLQFDQCRLVKGTDEDVVVVPY
jgi:hypothetical protein